MASSGPQDDLQGVIGPGGEAHPSVGPVGEGPDAQKELGPIGGARGGKDPFAAIQQGGAVIQDEGPGVVVGGGGLEQGQQGVPDPKLQGLIGFAVAVGQDMEPQHPLRGPHGGHCPVGQQCQQQTGGQQDEHPSFHVHQYSRPWPGPNPSLTEKGFLGMLYVWKICFLH